MPDAAYAHRRLQGQSRLDRTLSLFTEVHAGEAVTAVLMLVNILLLLCCYSIIKTVREPLILLGGGAEVRSYAAAGQALLLMGFVPLYSWFASRVDRVKLLVGGSLFFIICIELFATAVAAHVPYVGVAFFIWVGIFNMSLVAQFWSFANDLYRQEAGDRLFPVIAMGMTAGAPLGSIVAARLFGLGIAPQAILQISAALLAVSALLYLLINSREANRTGSQAVALPAGGGFGLVLRSPYLRLIAVLIVLLNVVNMTGEYIVARLLTIHVKELALLNPAFNAQAFIGAFSGNYQFWVNVTAFLLQAFVTSRLVKHRGLRGALLVLPLVALGGYTIIAAGVSFSVVRWIKTTENAVDYSIMNTARQLLWLPRTREEKYKAKQAIDTFFVRVGDLVSAAAVYVGTSVLHFNVNQFAMGNIVLTLVWLGVALMILQPRRLFTVQMSRGLATAAATVLIVVLCAGAAFAQSGREQELAEQRAKKATQLHPYEPTRLEREMERLDRVLSTERSAYLFMGSALEGGGLTLGPGYRTRYADTGTFEAHAGWSVRNYRTANAAFGLPAFARGRIHVEMSGNWIEAPSVAFYGLGNESLKGDRGGFFYRGTTVGVSSNLQAAKFFAVGGGVDYMDFASRSADTAVPSVLNPSYRRASAFAQVDTRTSPDYSRKGGLYRLDWSSYDQTNEGRNNFRRVDAEVQQYVPLLRENWVIALRALASSTSTGADQNVPYFLMPELGGTQLLRGYPSWRFRDRDRLLLTAEYRWTAGPFVDMAAFVDAGKVAHRNADLNLRGLKTSHGLEFSLHTPTRTIARIEIARSREATTLSLSFNPSF